MSDAQVAIVIDTGVLKDMFEDVNEPDKPAAEIRKKLKEMSEKNMPAKALTPLSNFLRAIFLMDPETPVKHIQNVLSFLTVLPSMGDFKQEKNCIEDIIFLAKIIGGAKNDANQKA